VSKKGTDRLPLGDCTTDTPTITAASPAARHVYTTLYLWPAHSQHLADWYAQIVPLCRTVRRISAVWQPSHSNDRAASPPGDPERTATSRYTVINERGVATSPWAPARIGPDAGRAVGRDPRLHGGGCRHLYPSHPRPPGKGAEGTAGRTGASWRSSGRESVARSMPE
jgi:hypothetical protein